MEKIVAVVANLPKSKAKNDDDFADRLSSRYTVVILVIFALTVTLQTYVGKPITCWAPKHFADSHIKFTNSYCWVRNTYYIPMSRDHMPPPNQPREHVIPYYQWVPFILLIQAVFFYLPSFFWHAFNQRGGVDCDNILESTHYLTTTTKDKDHDRTLTLITNQMHRFLESRTKKSPSVSRLSPQYIVKLICMPCNRLFGNFLVMLFLFSKLLYIGNVVAQIFILNAVLSTHFNMYGFDVIKYMLSNDDWEESPGVAFPRVTFCDFDVRRLGNTHRYTVQCTLPINMFTEKIYMFLWFWMVFIAIVSCLSLVVWLIRACLGVDRRRFIQNHLRMAKLPVRKDQQFQNDLGDFVNSYLCQDGVFILRLIAHNTNNITVTEVVVSLWDKFLKKEKKKGESRPTILPTTDDGMDLPGMADGTQAKKALLS